MDNTAVYQSFSFLVGFLVVFRTSQAYSRFTSGTSAVYKMQGAWFEAASSIIAFTNQTSLDEDTVVRFRHTVARLLSLLNALILAELAVDETSVADRAFQLELLDLDGLDSNSVQLLRRARSKTDLVFHWLQCLIVHGQKNKICTIPPPILSRTFHQLGLGMTQFHNAKMITQVPFPFPYTQTTEIILFMHWVLSPILVSGWALHWSWAFVFTFVQTFIFWALNTIAMELENPFDEDGDDDLNLGHLQRTLNRTLITLVQSQANEPPAMVGCVGMLGLTKDVSSLILETENSPTQSFAPVGRDLHPNDCRLRWLKSFEDGDIKAISREELVEERAAAMRTALVHRANIPA
jgi:predicted membrane chloride channel (bestrophin family)